eukprot:CAMPEP_0119128656 /NCGR_PEP_ID=MMETSP1310-20130426/6722_1 /TAXON_ID=464262 /ORGANISM="Genus nov. species nov., Strain RCC2339" /LENGTH=350 /DNA_ID=CAMNT_0007119015 /DNA_START=120 /DNA_END=1169 /DNA_ORIENTATION=-
MADHIDNLEDGGVPTPCILDLCDDIIHCIVTFLPNKEFGQLRCTCKQLSSMRLSRKVMQLRKCGLFPHWDRTDIRDWAAKVEFCCENGHSYCLSSLLETGADLSVLSMRNRNGQTRLETAASNGHVDAVLAIVKRAFVLGVPSLTSLQIEALHAVCSTIDPSAPAVLESLFDAWSEMLPKTGPGIPPGDGRGHLLVHTAARSGSVEILRALCREANQRYAVVGTVDALSTAPGLALGSPVRPLERAVTRSDGLGVEIIEELKANGLEVGDDEAGQAALVTAVDAGQIWSVTYLLDLGVTLMPPPPPPPPQPGLYRRPQHHVLSKAAQRGDAPMVDLLLSRCNVDISNADY